MYLRDNFNKMFNALYIFNKNYGRAGSLCNDLNNKNKCNCMQENNFIKEVL